MEIAGLWMDGMDQLCEQNEPEVSGSKSCIRTDTMREIHHTTSTIPAIVCWRGGSDEMMFIWMCGVAGQWARQRGQSISAARTPAASLQLST